MSKSNRRIDLTELADGALLISTVWLPYESRLETMVFRYSPDGSRQTLHDLTVHYSTEQEARDGHASIVAACRRSLAEMVAKTLTNELGAAPKDDENETPGRIVSV